MERWDKEVELNLKTLVITEMGVSDMRIIHGQRRRRQWKCGGWFNTEDLPEVTVYRVESGL
jgi:hypothetical protein